MKTIVYLFLFVSVLFCPNCTQQADNNSNEKIPSEKKEMKDRRTGVTIRQLTNYKGHSHHFYFTNPGWFDHEQKLMFSSDRNNRTNLFAIDLKNFSIHYYKKRLFFQGKVLNLFLENY